MKLKQLVENNKFKVNKLQKIVDQVVAYENNIASLSDDELKDKTREFKQRIADGETLDELLPEAFAVAREADKRVLGLFPYEVQIMGGIVLNQGNLAEMKTGEGKTLTETMPVYLNALTGKGVHVVTVNEYLSRRDFEEMSPVFEFLGLNVGLNGSKLSVAEKAEAYKCDITYSTNDELGFDYLRDNMVIRPDDVVQRGLNYVIVDEADSILIDEARTPLIIAGTAKSQIPLYKRADSFAKSLTPDDYDYDEETKTVSLEPSGVEKANQYFGLRNIYGAEHFNEAHYVDEALKANYALEKDHDYVVQVSDPTTGEKEVNIVDPNTGRVMEGRRYSDGLHQALEAKEGVRIRDANKTEADITYQNFFRMYKKLSGMSGTAATASEEFYDTYHMQVVVIPTNKPIARQDLPDVIYPTMRGKFRAIYNKIMEIHQTGRPILVGTISVENSELVSDMLSDRNIPHEVLNAKNNQREAQIIMNAGQRGAITIATNMAGRGTDIKLGPGVRELGGLYVLGTERHESERIDNQLRGRAGRQGDPGTSQFYVSFDDELMVRYGSERIKRLKEAFEDSPDQFEPIENKLAPRKINAAQRRVEGNNFDERKNTLRYDDVLRDERNAIYKQRQEILNFKLPAEYQNADNGKVPDYFKPYLIAMFARTINLNVNLYCQHEGDWNYDGLFKFTRGVLGFDFSPNSGQQELYKEVFGYEMTEQRIESMTKPEIKQVLLKVSEAEYDKRYRKLRNPEDILGYQKSVILRAIDVNWKENISNMEQLRMSVTLRGYGQYNPLVEYQKSSYDMYGQMLSNVEKDITRNYMRTEIMD